MYVEREASSRKIPNLDKASEIFAKEDSSGWRLIEDDKLFVWGNLEPEQEISEFEPIERFKWSEAENHKFVYTGFYNWSVLTATSRLSKMLSGDFLHNTAKAAKAEEAPQDEAQSNENTLYFINLSLNKADQKRKISYHPDGIPKSSAEERRHRELVYQTK